MTDSPDVVAERVENLRTAFEQLLRDRERDRELTNNTLIDVRVEIRGIRKDIAEDRTKADGEFDKFIEEEFKPLGKKVDGFITFQKLATALWTAVVFIGGMVAGASGWFRPK